MRISDWSSDVCSSDLKGPARAGPCRGARGRIGAPFPSSPKVSAMPFQPRVAILIPAADYGEHWRPALARKTAALTAAGLAVEPRMWTDPGDLRSEEPPSEIQTLMRNSYAVFCLKTK